MSRAASPAHAAPVAGLAALTVGIAALVASPAAGRAMVAPLATIGGESFAARTPGLLIDTVRIELTQLPADVAGGGPSAPRWVVDTELVVRNGTADAAAFALAALADGEDGAEVWVDGVPVETEETVIRQDPALPEHTYSRGQRLELLLPRGGAAVVRVRAGARGGVDALGQSWVELPTHALGLFGSAVQAGTLTMQPLSRPVALQTTIAGATTYDEPSPLVTWRLREWSPRVPFRATYLTPWSALLLVAEVEDCPDPWEVLRAATAGGDRWDAWAQQGVDASTLQFCGNLPDVLHGRPFGSDATRAQLAALTLDRYVADAPAVPLYSPNVAFDAASLTEAEALYARLLRMLAE
ncbi:MAG: hypothetical protein H6698_06105 [Myxococcales bacterium]|nr:hypothetical protein [Myxococcales bacterium]MCB9521695.1 hypothetical protein [Myxococcales bacterium]MCB9531911.1 hypothetical protein [Myxococcales bacterium]MCB9533879.1 hypothetical protein [Myxococcales bacterium]